MGTALVVGASSTIGRAIAVEVADLGHDVVLWGRHAGRLAETERACSERGVSARIREVDLLVDADVDDAVAEVAAMPLQAAVWAAGLFNWALVDQADANAWRRLLQVNLVAAAAVTAGLAPALLAAAPGSSLVYLGSGAARRAFSHNAAYVASKHGLAGLADAVDLDLRARGVKVSLVSPGLVAAGAGMAAPAAQSQPDRLLTPADVAHAVRFVLTFPGSGCPHEVTIQPALVG